MLAMGRIARFLITFDTLRINHLATFRGLARESWRVMTARRRLWMPAAMPGAGDG